ncbi:hypothetical protein [Methyloglobulus sp.]|uniref:hypothetical protein n=1 Tax=Methyloglobulus sp. TaxID=2518622 RepID=UPI003989C3C8
MIGFNRVLAPEGEILFFARAKKSIQKKARPDAAYFLRFSFSTGGDRRGFLPLDHRD